MEPLGSRGRPISTADAEIPVHAGVARPRGDLHRVGESSILKDIRRVMEGGKIVGGHGDVKRKGV